MNSREHRKHSLSDIRSMKLSSELLAFTMGVCLLYRNTTATAAVITAPDTATVVRVMPMASVKERNSTVRGTQLFF